MMPPHLTDTVPPDGGVLTGDTVLLRGYTFAMLDEAVDITGPDGQAVPHTLEMGGEWEGEGDLPGARQYRCIAAVRLTGPLRPGAYSLAFLGERLRFQVLPGPGG
ncbi:MAG: hypothetical protein H6702_17035 [Myxococcales bacterium]|nr:hypothetical protein [Myxococcales bacterium]